MGGQSWASGMVDGVGGAVGERVRGTQGERGCGKNSGREGAGVAVGKRVRETQWERG